MRCTRTTEICELDLMHLQSALPCWPVWDLQVGQYPSIVCKESVAGNCRHNLPPLSSSPLPPSPSLPRAVSTCFK